MPPMPGRRYLVAAPMYNEERVAALVVEDLLAALPPLGIDYEILIIDDGSTDRTPEILASFGDRLRVQRPPRNQGVGAAFAAMLDYAGRHGFTHFVFQEGSYKVRAAEVAKIIRIAEAGEYDYLLGSRFLRPEDAKQTPWQRRALIRPFSTLFRLITGFDVTDITCGPRLVRMAAWNPDLNALSGYFGYQFEHIITIWLLHHEARYRPVQVEIQYPPARSYSYINLGNIWQIIEPWVHYSVWRLTRLPGLRPAWLLPRKDKQDL
ncbi:MAG: glycosyltransferase family 2 protein [Thermodesulfobacteriota bacterium]